MSIWYKQPRKFIFPRVIDYKDIEDYLLKNFEGGYPVLVSSGRSAIRLLLSTFWDKKEIKIFKYASQCVVNACLVNNIFPSTPIANYGDIVYHQWGYPITQQAKNIFIEDACDTFYKIGSKVRRLDSRFEIWSLSKILGTQYGGVIWCKHKSDAEIIQQIRDATAFSSSKKLFFTFRSISTLMYRLWEKLELNHPKLSKIQLSSLYSYVIKWDAIFNNRQILLNNNIELVKKLGYGESILNEKLLILNQIIPTVIILKNNKLSYNFKTVKAHMINKLQHPQCIEIYPYLTSSIIKIDIK